MSKHPYQTMSLAFQQICQGERDWTALGDFMNDWYENHIDERERLITDPLPENYPLKYHRWAAFCAASAEWFAHKYSIPCPEWVQDPRYMLAKPWFYGMGTHKQLQRTTPEEFAQRNIFCGADIYANKWEFVADLWVRYRDKLAARVGQPSEELSPYIETAQQRRALQAEETPR